MIGIAALVVGIVLGLVFHPSVPEVIQPYLPIAVVAALDAVFGGLRAYLERIFDPKVFVVSFVFNVFVAALIVYVGDQLGVGTQLSTAIIVVLGIRIFGNAAALRRRLFGALEFTMSDTDPARDAAREDRSRRRHRHPETRPGGRRARRAWSTRAAAAQPQSAIGGRSPADSCDAAAPFGALAVVLCLVLGVAIVTQVRQTDPATRWRRRAPPTCWSCSTRCSSARPHSTPKWPICSAR